MKDFWISCGHHLLDRDAEGRLLVTDAFLKAYLARPELLPPETACEAELALHHDLLMHRPRRPVGADEIAAIKDEDARENWAFMIAFRDLILSRPTLEAAYLALARGAAGGVPPLFMNQLAQVVLRNALDGEADAHVLRAAEWRPEGIVFYSLGNLITYGPFNNAEPINRGAVACVDLAGRDVIGADLRPTVQRFPGVVARDSSRRAQFLIDSLSALDFPLTGARIDRWGEVRPPRRVPN